MPLTPPGDRARLDLLFLRSLEARADAAFREGHDVGTMVALLVADVTAETAAKLALGHIGKRDSSGTIHDLLVTLCSEREALRVHEDPIRRLRKARNPLQHEGAVPAAGVVALHLRAMRAFLAGIAREVFGIELDAVSAVGFVADSEIRAALSTAIEALDADDLPMAIAASAAAFEAYRIVWGRWTRRATGITREDESFHAGVLSIAALGLSVERASEPMLSTDAWQSLAIATMGLPIPLLARWRHVVHVAENRDDGDAQPIQAEELRKLIDRLALAIWSAETSHPRLMDGDSPRPE